MNRLQKHLVRAGTDLGIKVIVPFELSLGSGKRVSVEVFLPQFGGAKGMIIVRSFDDLLGIADKLVMQGYGYSVLDEPLPNENYDVDSYKELFSDWGWTSVEEKKPDWMQ